MLYVLGLCEGNHCSSQTGKDVGHGKVIVMAREDDGGPTGGCYWKTVRTIDLPMKEFVDYSALAIHHRTKAVAITSQENAQVWVGELSTGSDGEFDPMTAEFSKGKVYDFPRAATCAVQYCNIEGIEWCGLRVCSELFRISSCIDGVDVMPHRLDALDAAA